MILINRKNKLSLRGTYIALVILLGICMYYIYNYMILYEHEENERLLIQQMEQDMFPSILPNLHIPCKIKKLSNDGFADITIHPEFSEKSSNSTYYKSSWKGDCILSIPDIELEKIVYTGSDRLDHLNDYGLATAADNMQYVNGGNYIICGHASRLYGHSLNRIKEIKKGTIIYIKTPKYTDQYIVDQVTFEKMDETSKYCKQTLGKRITIISCAKYISKESYIVIQAVPN